MPNPKLNLIRPAVFEPDGSAPALRFEQWMAQRQSYDLQLPEGTTIDDFATRCSLWNLGSSMMTVGNYSPMISVRPEKAIRADQIDHYSLRVNLGAAGIAGVDIDGQRQTAEAGEIVLLDLARPARYHSPGGHVAIVFIPRQALDSLLPRPLEVHGLKLRGPCARLLTNHLDALTKSLSELSPAEAQGASSATISLLAASVASTPVTVEQARPAIETTILRQMLAYIDAHLRCEALSASQLCGTFKVSRTTLYRLFEPLGGVAQEIRKRRLKRIHKALAAPENSTRQIVRIAQEFGFKDATHFSRVFRENYGYTPTEAHGRAGSTSLPVPVPGTYHFDNWMHVLGG